MIVLVVLAGALLLAPAAHGYGWPVAPFNLSHPIRGNFGDPRTIFYDDYNPDRIGNTGSFSFHNGIDIVAEPGAPVFPVLSGTVTNAVGSKVVVKASRGRTFQYAHIEPAVVAGQQVVARRTVLGTVQAAAAHVHLTELDHGRVVNPLLPGHLAPYRDTTKPRVNAVLVRAPNGKDLDPLAVSGAVSLAVDASDLPSLPVPGSWNGLPVTPASISWSLSSLAGRYVVPPTVAIDFRYSLPFNRNFWQVYARGTYQNKPRFANRQFSSMAGRYVFRLTHALLDTTRLRDETYLLEVTAADARGNRTTLTLTLAVCNASPDVCAKRDVYKGER
jgi:Peptidase family M23